MKVFISTILLCLCGLHLAHGGHIEIQPASALDSKVEFADPKSGTLPTYYGSVSPKGRQESVNCFSVVFLTKHNSKYLLIVRRYESLNDVACDVEQGEELSAEVISIELSGASIRSDLLVVEGSELTYRLNLEPVYMESSDLNQ